MNVYKHSLLFALFGLFCFLIFSVVDTVYRQKTDAAALIKEHIFLLKEALEKVHHDCTILDFDAQKNPINFLNVAAFSGSQVGPMNLMHPEKWQGPYVKDNPTLYHIAYQVVVTNKGYFITPGDGVVLPNKKTIGKEIILDSDADIAHLMTDSQALLYRDTALAVPLDIKNNKTGLIPLDEDGEL